MGQFKDADSKYIGIFNDGFPPIFDGVTQTVLSYVNNLKTSGYKPCVVTPYNPVKISTDYEVIRYFSLPIRSRKPYRYGYPKLDPFIWYKMRNTPFHLIHSHSPFAAGRLGVYAKKKQGIPLIGTFHSKYKSDLKHSFKRAPWCVPIIMKRILNFYNACDEVWIPQASVEETVREYGYKGDLVVMDNGIDYADLNPDEVKSFKQSAKKELGIPEEELSLLFVGQHIWEKGIGIILESLRLIDGKLPFTMSFIGNGYAKNELIQRIRNYNLQDRIKNFDVIIDRDELKKHYASADLFLFPSMYDNAPLVVREAASLGTPSIIPVGSTASQVIKDGENGFLIEATPEAYAEKILSLSGQRDLLPDIGLRAKTDFVKNWEEVMAKVLDRYLHLIKRTRG